MSGLSYGTKYTYSKAKRDNNKSQKKEGIFLSDHGKYIVLVENHTKSKNLRPYIAIRQFDEIEKAEEFWKTIRP